MYVCITESLCYTLEIQHCKSTILQLKKILQFKKGITLSMGKKEGQRGRNKQSFQSTVQERVTILSTLDLEAGEFLQYHPIFRFHVHQRMFWI